VQSRYLAAESCVGVGADMDEALFSAHDFPCFIPLERRANPRARPQALEQPLNRCPRGHIDLVAQLAAEARPQHAQGTPSSVRSRMVMCGIEVGASG